MYIRSGTAWYVHPDGRWQKLGRDLEAAAKLAREFNAGRPDVGTVSHWLDRWLVYQEARVAAGELAARTYADYKDNTKPLKAYFGKMPPQLVETSHVNAYLEMGRNLGRAVRANRERAAFSAFFTWLIASAHAKLARNPCSGARRNTERERRRYVEDFEFHAVMAECPPVVRAWAELIYRTLQRPSDILAWTDANLLEADGRKYLRFQQSKTGAHLKIIVTPVIKRILDEVARARPRGSEFLIPREDGGQYTESGLASMFRKATQRAKVKNFAPYDCKAKGATDMFEAGQPIEEISALCGHDSIRTTQIYIKRHLRRALTPNERDVPQAVPAAPDEDPAKPANKAAAGRGEAGHRRSGRSASTGRDGR
jgi:integrase